MSPRWPLVAVLVAAVILAGCTNPDATPSDEAPGGDPAAPAPGRGGASPPATGAAVPRDVLLEDAGALEGPFSASWPLTIENVAFRAAAVEFSLQGPQAGAPATARVRLALIDPAGNEVKSEVVGLGGAGDALAWTLTNAEIQQAGVYTLAAMSQAEGPLPSVGVGSYSLRAVIDY